MTALSGAPESAKLGYWLETIRARRMWLLAIVFLGTVFGTSYAFLVTPDYSASATLIVREGNDSSSGAQALLGQLGGLAALGGLTISESSASTEYLTWIRSRQFAQRFIERHKLMPRLFESVWDSKRGDWIAGLPPADIPTEEDAWRLFDRRIRSVSQDKRTGLVTLQTRWRDRAEAALWIVLMIQQANEELRARAIAEADLSLEYLNKELGRTEAVELQQSIYRLMEVQIKRKVLANSRADFAFSIIDPPVVPDADRYSHPNRPLIIAASLFASVLFGLATVLVLGGSTARATRSRVTDAGGT